MKNYKRLIFLFVLTSIVSFTFTGCINDDVEELLGGIGDVFNSKIDATIQFDDGEEVNFDGYIIPIITWDNNSDGTKTLTLVGQAEFPYDPYQLALLGLEIYDIDGPGEYSLYEGSPHIEIDYNDGIMFNMYADNDEDEETPGRYIYFELGNGVVKVDKLNAEHSKGSFELELFVLEETADNLGEYFYNPHDLEKATIKGTYEGNVIVQ